MVLIKQELIRAISIYNLVKWLHQTYYGKIIQYFEDTK